MRSCRSEPAAEGQSGVGEGQVPLQPRAGLTLTVGSGRAAGCLTILVGLCPSSLLEMRGGPSNPKPKPRVLQGFVASWLGNKEAGSQASPSPKFLPSSRPRTHTCFSRVYSPSRAFQNLL